MPLHPDAALAIRRAGDLPTDLSPDELRQAYERQRLTLLPEKPAVAITYQLSIPSDYGPIPARFYRPTKDSKPCPLLVYFHGGGWVWANIDTHDRMVREYAAAGDVCAVSVDYALSPEAKFPQALEECAAVVEGGHEIGHHSWAHIPPANQTREEEEADLVRANENIRKLTGNTAKGYRSPSWDLSEHTVDLLIKHGFLYDTSLMGGDYIPYLARRGDVAELNKPYRLGEATSLIEMPISWSLDDYPHFEFVRTPQTVLASMQPARAVMQSWFDEFLYMKKTTDWGVLTYTMHPYVIGRGYRMLALEGLVAQLADNGAVFMTMEQAALEAKQKLFA